MHWFRNRRVRGRPAHPDVLTPASRSALARFALGAPFGWLRGGLGASWVGKAALVAGVAAISVGGYVAVAGLSGAGGDGVVPPLATAPAVPTETPVSTPDLREQIAGGAIRYLSESMDEPPEEIEVERIGEARWSNACLGVEIPDRECVGRPIDGFQITLTIRGDDLRPQQVRATLDGEYVWVPEFGGTARLADIDASGGIVDIDIVHVGGPSRVLPGTYLGVVLSELEPGDLVSFGLAYGAPGTDTGAVVWLVPAPEPVPEGTETGIPEVDSVIALFLAGDVEAIESRLIYTEAKCVEEPEIGRTVVCADDEEPGTLVLAFPGVLGCHGGMVRHDEEVRSQAPVGGELYGVGVVGGAEWSGAEYVIVMTGGRFVLVNSDGIVGWGGDCGPSSYYLDGIASRVILHGPGYSR